MSEIQENRPRNAGRIIARNTIFGLLAQFGLRIVSFLFTVIVIRSLGSDDYGQYSIILAWAGLFSVIGDMGVNQYLSREIARDKSKVQELFWDTVALRIVLAAAASVITSAGAVIAGYTPEIVIGIVIYTSSYFLQAALAPLASILNGNERVDVISILTVVGQVLFMLLAAAFLWLNLGFVWLVIAAVINLPIMIGLHLWFIRRYQLSPPRYRVNPRIWWTIIKAGWPFAVIQLALSFSYQVDTIILSQNVSDNVVGWYNTAYSLTLSLLTVTRAFNNAILPTLAREHASNPGSVRPWYYTSVRFIILIGLPIAVGGSLLSGDIIGVLYGPEFLPASLALVILVWDMPVVMYTSFCGNMTTSIKREHAASNIYLSMGVTNLVLNVIFIPSLGMIGACFATLLTDSIGAAQFYLLFRREFGTGLKLTRLLRVGFAALVMGILVYLLHDLNLFLIVSIAGLLYITLVWFLGAFTNEERARITGFVMHRLPGSR